MVVIRPTIPKVLNDSMGRTAKALDAIEIMSSAEAAELPEQPAKAAEQPVAEALPPRAGVTPKPRWARDFGEGIEDAAGALAESLWGAVLHPIDTAVGLGQIAQTAVQAASGDRAADRRVVASGVALAGTIRAAFADNPVKALGHGLVDVGTLAFASAKAVQVVGASAKAAGAARAVPVANAAKGAEAADAAAAVKPAGMQIQRHAEFERLRRSFDEQRIREFDRTLHSKKPPTGVRPPDAE